MLRRGCEILADALRLNGVDLVFHVPGESFLSVLDALGRQGNGIKTITCRHENGMAIMAEAYGKLTGRPGIAFATRSPGATNAAGGVHTAYQDASPMILFVGQVKRGIMEREAFMSYNFREMFGPMAKWVAQIDDAARIPEFVQRAFHVATSGRMGPVVLVLPEDMLEDVHDIADARVTPPVFFGASSEDSLARAKALLEHALRPLIIVGGPNWTTESRDSLQTFALRNRIPIVTAFRRRDIIDHAHECYAGEIGIGSDRKLLAKIRRSDLVLVISDALSDVNTIGHGYMEGFTLLDIPNPTQILIRIHNDRSEVNRVFQADLGVICDPPLFCAALGTMGRVTNAADRDWLAELRANYEADFTESSCPGDLDLPAVFKWLRSRVPEDTIITNGVGAYAGWSQRYFRHHSVGSQLGPISGSMGYGLPAALAAKLARPDSIVVALAGDGCLKMTSEELATAVKYGVNIIVLVINNNMFGTIRIHEETKLDGRATGTDLSNPDFVAFARSFGAFGERVRTTAEFEPAFERAISFPGPALIELLIDPNAINTRYSLQVLQERRQPATARQTRDDRSVLGEPSIPSSETSLAGSLPHAI